MADKSFDTVIFDLGGVLIDWNPEYVFRQVFDDEEEMRYFLTEICSPAWNEEQDAGRPLAEATELLVAEHPQYEEPIRAYYGRWEEMLGDAIHDTVALLEGLYQSKSHRLLALTNWSYETFPVALERFDFLQWFEGILVSGHEKLKKPDPRIYRRLFEKYEVNVPASIFIDDNARNVAAAEGVGLEAIHFTSPDQLRRELGRRKVIEVS